MKFGIFGPADVSAVDRSVRAEQLGFDFTAFGDSPIIYSDIFATMAVVAQATSKITIGAAVTPVGIRMPQVAAAGYATVNRLAPGRVFGAFGTGMTAYQLLGHRTPVKMTEMADYVGVVRKLLGGQEVDLTFNGATKPIKFLEPDLGYININDRIPLYFAAMGPKGQTLAGELADGLFDGWGPMFMLDQVKERVGAGAAKVGRNISDFAYFGPGAVVVLDPGEDLTSDRVIELAGVSVALILHGMYLQFGKSPADEMPPFLASFWDDYRAMMAAWPDPDRFHYRAFAGHGMYLHPEERRFITPDLIKLFTVVGQPEEIVEQIHMWEKAGITHLSLTLNRGELGDDHMERFAAQVLTKL